MDIDGQTLPYRPEGYTPKVTVESAGGLTLLYVAAFSRLSIFHEHVIVALSIRHALLHSKLPM